MKATIHFVLRLDRPNTDGSATIYMLLLVNNGRKFKFSLNRNIPLKKAYQHLTPDEILKYPMTKHSPGTLVRDELYYWDKTKQRATRGLGSMESLNQYLNDQMAKAETILNDFAKRLKPITKENFERTFFRKANNQSFYEYCDYQLNVARKNSLATETRKSYTLIIKKLDRYRPGLKMEEIDHKFLTLYCDWMRKPRKEGGCENDERTIANNLKVLRTMIRLAIRNEDFPVEFYPFSNFPISNAGSELTSRDFLEPEEIMMLEGLMRNYIPPSNANPKRVNKAEWKKRLEDKQMNPGEYQTLRYFLFACYTGLRYKDVLNLDVQEHIRQKWVINPLTKERRQRYYIDIQEMHKTSKPLIVPLIDKAVALLNMDAKGKAFPVISNQKTNQHLKYIARIAGIEKVLSFHVARHSFATTCFTYGIPDRVGQELLGHKSEKFIKVYAHLTQNHLFLEMEKVNQGYDEYEQLLQVVQRPEQATKVLEHVEQRLTDDTFREAVEMLVRMDRGRVEKVVALIRVVG